MSKERSSNNGEVQTPLVKIRLGLAANGVRSPVGYVKNCKNQMNTEIIQVHVTRRCNTLLMCLD